MRRGSAKMQAVRVVEEENDLLKNKKTSQQSTEEKVKDMKEED